jgi:hypothetical protein
MDISVDDAPGIWPCFEFRLHFRERDDAVGIAVLVGLVTLYAPMLDWSVRWHEADCKLIDALSQFGDLLPGCRRGFLPTDRCARLGR